MEFKLEEIIEFKKPHPCGSTEWRILRTGVDLKLACVKCGREIMIPRVKAIKKMKAKKQVGL
jgi:hypothetical protein